MTDYQKQIDSVANDIFKKNFGRDYNALNPVDKLVFASICEGINCGCQGYIKQPKYKFD